MANLVVIFISGLLVSFTGYAIYTAFWATLSTTKRSI